MCLCHDDNSVSNDKGKKRPKLLKKKAIYRRFIFLNNHDWALVKEEARRVVPCTHKPQ